MRTMLVLVGLALIAVVFLMTIGMVSIDGGRLPTVALRGGEAPRVDVGRIDVGTTERTVEVPRVAVRRANETAPAQ